MRKFNKQQRNYIIMGLCAILVIMAVGYAAFQSQLKINGTSNITNNFLVKITDIQSKDIVGGALDKADVTTHTDTTATFGTTLQSPGDSITYDITIENQGNIDAILKTIVKTDTSNSAILFETSGVNEGDLLNAGDVTTMHVKVTYNPAVTSQPSDLNSTLKVELNYEQAGGSIVGPGGETVTPSDLKALAVTEGDGLYADTYEPGRYMYKGANPNNYITFNNETWRIISVESNNPIKIVKNESLGDRAFDSKSYRDNTSGGTGGTYCTQSGYGCNAWTINDNFVNGSYSGTVLKDAEINVYLNGEYLNSITTNKDKIKTDASWSIGGISYGNNDLANQIKSENGITGQGSIALPTVSEYLRANTNNEKCGNLSLITANKAICKTTNWMLSIVPSDGDVWLLSPPDGDTYHVFRMYNANHDDGTVHRDVAYHTSGVTPTLYLTSDITLTGTGEVDNPYVIG